MNRVLQAQTAIVMAGVISSLSYSAIWSQAGLESAKSFMVTDVNPDVPSEEIQRRASAGHLREELELAGDYYTGRGVSRDLSQAAYWYRRAADQGDPGAQVDMGYLYLKGIGVKPDAAQAAKWFQRAASSGSPTGKLDLAVLYLKGMGVPQDSHLALTLLTDLAKHEDARGEAYLGFLYMLGVGAERNLAMRSIGLKRRRNTIVPRPSMRWVRSFRSQRVMNMTCRELRHFCACLPRLGMYPQSIP